MKYKYAFLFYLSFIFIKTVISYEIMSKFEEKKTYESSIFLDVSDFEEGDHIHISIDTDDYTSSRTLYYEFYETIDGISVFSATNSVEGKKFGNIYYSIEKTKGNAKYLYLKYDFDLPITIDNTRDNNFIAKIVILSTAGFIVLLAIIIPIIVCSCMCCRKNKTVVVIPAANPTSQEMALFPSQEDPVVPDVQPQLNPNNNLNDQIQQNQPGSDDKIES